MADLTFQNVNELQMFLTQVSPRATLFLAGAMVDVLTEVFHDSQGQVPVDTGALKSSGRILPPTRDASNKMESGIAYGGGEGGDNRVNYAMIVHENLNVNHPHGKAKYLEDPLNSALSKLNARVVGRLEAELVSSSGNAFGPGSSIVNPPAH